MANISKNSNGSTITISDGNSVADWWIGLIVVYSQGNNVVMAYNSTGGYISYPYTQITVSGSSYGSAAATEAAIAALLVLPGGGGGGTISGTIAAPQVAYGVGADEIGGDATFLFSNDGNKEVTANYYKIANAGVLGSPVNGYLEFDGVSLYFTTGGVRYAVQLRNIS